MIKTFKYTTDLKESYGVSQLGFKKGDIFKLIDTKLSCIEKISEADWESSVHEYEYTIYIPKDGCFILNDEMWQELIMYCEYVEK
jgi:hypothetical protein